MSVSARAGVVCAGVVLLIAAVPSAGAATGRWVGAWGASAQATFANVGETGISVDSVCPAPKGLSNQTVRDVVSPSVDGSRLRVRLSNAFGTSPLTVGTASVAGELSGADAVPGTMHRLTFAGKPTVTIPAGGEVMSDSVAFPVRTSENLLLSIYVAKTTHSVTEDWDAQQDSFETTGNRALDRRRRTVCRRTDDLLDARRPRRRTRPRLASRAPWSRSGTRSPTASCRTSTPTTAGPTTWRVACRRLAARRCR